MKKMWPVQDQSLWYVQRVASKPCDQNLQVEVVIVGGGMAGLSAAQEFNKQGKRVVLLEQYYCGSGATGKSSGFITNNAELSFTDFSKRYDFDVAKQIWNFIGGGVDDIRFNITNHTFICGYLEQDALMMASHERSLKEFHTERENLQKAGFPSVFFDRSAMQQLVGSNGYFGALAYEKSFGIDAYAYCQQLKQHLESQGVQIFEETAVTQIQDHTITTAHAQITADFIVVCADRFLPDLQILSDDVYHAQTFVMASEVLTDQQIVQIFPQGRSMVWDSNLLYHYFRITADKRLILGGGDLWSTYASQETHGYHTIVKKLTQYFHQKFPQVDIAWKYVCPGLMGLSKDIGPIAGQDKDLPHIYYIAASAGLSIAAALGKYSAQHLLQGRNDLDQYFSPYRKFPIGGVVQKILGTKLTFALCNALKHHIP